MPKFINNIINLGVLQVANMVLPLLVLPYLLRTLGVDGFGILAFSMAIVMFCSIVNDYGFNLTATRDVSINRGDKLKVNEIFSCVMTLKLVIFFVITIVLFTASFLIPSLFESRGVIFSLFGVVLGGCIFPLWFFQGVEKMGYITIINLISRLFYVIGVFSFVKDSDDIFTAALIQSLSFLLSGGLALYYVVSKFKLRYEIYSPRVYIKYISSGYYVFISNVFISFYTYGTLIFLGLYANSYMVGLFSTAHKIAEAAKGAHAPISQAVYPYLAKSINDNYKDGFKKSIIFLVFAFFLNGTISLLIYLYSSEILYFVGGNEYLNSDKYLKILAPLPLLVGMSNVIGIHILLNIGGKKAFGRNLIVSSVVSVILFYLFVPKFGAEASAIILISIELLVLVLMSLSVFYYVRFRKNEESVNVLP